MDAKSDGEGSVHWGRLSLWLGVEMADDWSSVNVCESESG